MLDSTPYMANLAFQIQYVDVPRDATPLRFASRPRRVATRVGRAAIALFAAATLAFVVFGFANAEPRSPGDPVRGEFRLGPGNQEPPGYVIPLRQGKVLVRSPPRRVPRRARQRAASGRRRPALSPLPRRSAARAVSDRSADGSPVSR